MPALLQKIILSAAVVALAVQGAPYSVSRDAALQRNGPKAIYFQTNSVEQNAVVALAVKYDGTLSPGSVTETGGKGSNVIDMSSGEPFAPDALNSQSSVTIFGHLLFAVNAGSNTLSMFSISTTDSTKLTAVGSPAAIPGDFPNTVAVSAMNNLVCVGTSGKRSGVSCASFSSHGLGKMDALRPFGLGQTTPPVGPFNTVSQVFFSLDETVLFATVKGSPPDTTGFLSAFPVNGDASLSTRETRSSPAGTALLFGTKQVHGTSTFFITDPSFGATVLAVDSSNQATVVARVAIPDQALTCWSTISEVTGSAFVTDGGVNRLVEMSVTDASIISITDLSANGNPSMTDVEAAGDFIYALSPGNDSVKASLVVLDVSRGNVRQIQHYDLTSTGAIKNSQGMAFMM